MTDLSEQLKDDLIDARNKVKETRTNLTGRVIEKRAAQAGMSIMEFSQDKFNGIESSLSRLSDKLSAGTYDFGDENKLKMGDFGTEIKRIQLEMRNYRTEISGGHIEDKTIKALHSAEKKLTVLVKKLK